MKVVIIEDEELAARRLENMVKAIDPTIEVVAKLESVADSVTWFQNNPHPDLIFLDINMPGISGVEFLKTLKNPPKVIFTTAYRNFAVDAFELDALDYLVKPISFERFLKSINRFLSIHQPEIKYSKESQTKDYIILKADKKNHKIKLSEILYIESLDNYIKVYTNELSVISYESLSNMEKKLPEDFLRIHRSFLVNLSKVDVFTSSYVEISGRKFTIGRNYREQVSKKLN